MRAAKLSDRAALVLWATVAVLLTSVCSAVLLLW
jgi:hypothetical protein